MSDPRLIGQLEFCPATEVEDVELLESVLEQRWNVEVDIHLDGGKMLVWRDDSQ